MIDAGFLELTRFGELSATDPLIANSLAVVDKVLASQTPSGVGFHRYGTLLESVDGQNVPITGSTDGYGDCYAPAPMHCPLTGQPWIPSFAGTGHLWPLLNGERGEQDLQTGDLDGASTMLLDMADFADGVGMIPEQDCEDPDVAPSPYGTATVTGTTSPGTSVVVAATLSPSGATQPGGTAHSQPVPTQTQQLTTADGSFTVPRRPIAPRRQ